MNHQMLMAFFAATQVLFAFAFGSCVGSLINVLVYRMPLGLSVVSPPSRCPKCDHLLSWRENIPVFGWLMLRGKCRFCKNPISPEYPIVEAIVGLVFVGFYTLWFLVPDRNADWLGFDWSLIKPEWAMNGFARTWPVFVALLMMVSALIAMTIIDARTFTIPLALAWTPTLVGFLAHPLWAAWVQIRGKPWRHVAEGDWWAIATPGVSGWPILCASLGAIAGLLISNALLGLGLLRRSFADYDEWETKALAEAGIDPDAQTKPDAAPPPDAPTQPDGRARTVGVVLACTAGCAVAGAWMMPRLGLSGVVGALAGVLAGVPLAGVILRAIAGTPPPPTDPDEGSPAEMWIQYPHARREVSKELLFLAPCLALAVVGWLIGQRLGQPWGQHPVTFALVASKPIPLWLSVLGGVCMGYLAGGGIVWAIRIFGTLGFGKEAMGLGDVHLLAAVGACVGWIDAVLAFFVAPFIALYIVLVQTCWTGNGRRAMPYGPYLAVATLVVVLGKAAFEAGLGRMFGAPGSLNFP
ncbi:MAG: A24 family peptidase [Phycisphaerales bacterium]|nr:A24 family peptidase [Phycisphaerales bacterium]